MDGEATVYDGMRVRQVNRRFKVVAEDRLNLVFKKIEATLDALINAVEISLGYTRDNMEISCITKLLNMLEILKLQYTIIIATIWRYVYNGYYKTCKSSMYAGLIIDTFDAFIWKFKVCPNLLYGPAILNAYSLPPEVSGIILMTKQFCVHFDKINEERLPDSLVLSGCKILDILNCSRFADKRLHFERQHGSTYQAKYSFFFKNSWFMAVPIISAKRVELSQKQRLMHMRLRRIVLAHNDMNLQQEQFCRENLIRPRSPTTIKAPGSNVYTGFGDVEDIFYYYGVMNEAAYAQRFGSDDDMDEDGFEDAVDLDQDENQHIELIAVNSNDDVLYSFSHLGFKVDVNVDCPLAYAPLIYLKNLPLRDTRKLMNHTAYHGDTRIGLNFECYGANYLRLPVKYNYKFWARR
ncbi:uncharacterized protein LOC132699027 isoform X2 [Cylas formicarius]|uniref:uncharacterized protein LOC132699027 isoform X2 n=1 Tax=Cylas formicarius TaxID=197179 RepID=UPI00295899DD|nr:uncharacterized protein LOC132699027 isoform X2 [Cylas formicarius]